MAHRSPIYSARESKEAERSGVIKQNERFVVPFFESALRKGGRGGDATTEELGGYPGQADRQEAVTVVGALLGKPHWGEKKGEGRWGKDCAGRGRGRVVGGRKGANTPGGGQNDGGVMRGGRELH